MNGTPTRSVVLQQGPAGYGGGLLGPSSTPLLQMQQPAFLTVPTLQRPTLAQLGPPSIGPTFSMGGPGPHAAEFAPLLPQSSSMVLTATPSSGLPPSGGSFFFYPEKAQGAGKKADVAAAAKKSGSCGACCSHETKKKTTRAAALDDEQAEELPLPPRKGGGNLKLTLLMGVMKSAALGKWSFAGERYGLKYPSTPQQLKAMGPPWLTKALRAAGTIDAATEVESFTVEGADTLGGSGQLSDIVHGDIVMSNGTKLEVVYKFVPTHFGARMLCDLYELVESEYHAYRDLQELVPVRMPKLYYGDFNKTTKNVCMIMEKIKNAEFNNFLKKPAKMEQYRKMIPVLAKIHGKWLQKKGRTPELDVFNDLDKPLFEIIATEGMKHWTKVREKTFLGQEYKDQLTYVVPEPVVEAYPDICKNIYNLLEYFAANKETWGLLHGDGRLDNWFFLPDGSVGLVDWQLCMKGSVCSGELTHAMSMSTTEEFFSAHEQELFDFWFDCLQKEVAPRNILLDKALFQEEYALGYLWLLAKMITASGDFDPEKPDILETLNHSFPIIFKGCMKWDSVGCWKKFCKGELLAQNKYPELKRFSPN